METPNLNTALSRIGIRISSNDIKTRDRSFVDLEETIIKALYEARNDGRLLSLIFSWQTINGEYLITEKFFKLRDRYQKILGFNHLINAFCAYSLHLGLHKYKKGSIRLKKEQFLLREAPAAVKGSGAVTWLKEINIICPTSHFVLKPESIMSPKELVQFNLQFRNRLIYGANWRADIITAIQLGIENPSKIKELIGCSYEPANRIFKQYLMATTNIT
ncbi:MAG: hypothetical protein H7336_03335 [Bacteriovorax sp.]|nr:hypothetical protein [Bacteriovorax sp.]